MMRKGYSQCCNASCVSSMTILSALAVLPVLLFLQIPQVEGDYVVSVLTRSFSNPDNMCARFCGVTGSDVPSCCDARNETTGQCAVCDSISFRYCLRHRPMDDCTPTRTTTPSRGQEVDFTSDVVLGLPNPLLLPTTTGQSGLWSGTRLEIRVFEYDDGIFDGLIDNFIVNIAASTVPGSPVSDSYTGRQNIVTIELTYQIMCSEGFIGDTCNRDLCFNVNCNQGTCADGNCMCNGGYMGERCDMVDPCFDVNCIQGTCADGNCVCSEGYIENECNVVDPCFMVDCGNGKCDPEMSAAVCRCNPGYTGTICDIDICDCKPMGTCVVQGSEYTCSCDPGFIGDKCETRDFCADTRHQANCSHGTCVNQAKSFGCDCDPGYTGTTCDIDICDCKPMETCEVRDSVYTCRCDPGFIGDRCETRDVCADTRHQVANCSHGTCVNQAESFGCDCDPGYTGTFCEVAVMCENSSCNGRGQCHNMVESYVCVCDSGYTGSDCEDRDLVVQPLMIIWVGTGVGGFIGVVVVLVLITIVIVALIRRRPKELNSTAGEVVVWNGDSDNNAIPRDNPVYMLAPGESHVNSAIYDIIGQPLQEERLFKNPMYGDPDPQQYEVPVHGATPTSTKEDERIFENPMYRQPDPTAYEDSVTNFLLEPMTTPTTKRQRGLSVSNIYEEPARPARTNIN